MSRDESGSAVPPKPRAATVLESVEEIRAQIARTPIGGAAASAPPPVSFPPAAAPSHAAQPAPAATPAGADDTRPFRPAFRPSMAVLTVLDDGDDAGEVIRLRGNSFLIGRVEGDLVIPHDPGISGRHAEVVRVDEGGRWRWILRDLNSTNGTFARAANTLLKPGQEFLVGGCRLRFDAPAAAPAPAEDPNERATTRKWQVLPAGGAAAAAVGSPSLVELTPAGEGRRHVLDKPEAWIGRDARCEVRLDDPMVSPRHAKVARNDRGQWAVANAKSLNGLWVRVAEIGLDRGGQFQCGEQRFVIKVL